MELTSPFARDKGLLRMSFTRFSLIFIYNKHRHPPAIAYHMNSFLFSLYTHLFDFSHFLFNFQSKPIRYEFFIKCASQFFFPRRLVENGQRTAVMFAQNARSE